MRDVLQAEIILEGATRCSTRVSIVYSVHGSCSTINSGSYGINRDSSLLNSEIVSPEYWMKYTVIILNYLPT